MKKLLVVSAILTSLLLVACGGSSEVDTFLGEYETLIADWEKKAESASSFTADEVTKFSELIAAKGTEWGTVATESTPNEDQAKKMADLTTRATQVVTKVSSKIKY